MEGSAERTSDERRRGRLLRLEHRTLQLTDLTLGRRQLERVLVLQRRQTLLQPFFVSSLLLALLGLFRLLVLVGLGPSGSRIVQGGDLVLQTVNLLLDGSERFLGRRALVLLSRKGRLEIVQLGYLSSEVDRLGAFGREKGERVVGLLASGRGHSAQVTSIPLEVLDRLREGLTLTSKSRKSDRSGQKSVRRQQVASGWGVRLTPSADPLTGTQPPFASILPPSTKHLAPE